VEGRRQVKLDRGVKISIKDQKKPHKVALQKKIAVYPDTGKRANGEGKGRQGTGGQSHRHADWSRMREKDVETAPKREIVCYQAELKDREKKWVQ